MKKVRIEILATIAVELLICLDIFFQIQKRGVKRASRNGIQVVNKYSTDVPAEWDLDKNQYDSILEMHYIESSRLLS